MTLYCQGCDYSFTDHPANAFPHHCPECGGAHFATWKPGETPAFLLTGRMIPVPNANACAGTFPVTIYDTTGAAPHPFQVNITGPVPGAASVSVIPFSGATP